MLEKECISFASERENARWKLSIRLFTLFLMIMNVIGRLVLYDWWGLLIYFTNWALEANLAVNFLVIWCSFDP